MRFKILSNKWMLLFFFALAGHLTFGQNATGLKALEGSWMGPVTNRGKTIRLVINIGFNVADSAIVTIDSPDQGAKGIPTSKVTYRNDSLIVEVSRLRARFSGAIDSGLTTITGNWKQLTFTLPLTVTRQQQKVSLLRPQEPVPPFPYRTEEVTVRNTVAGFNLSGTLTLPEGKGPFPAVVLISGSGPQNRDEEVMGHKPFLVLADYLTRKGLAVLRYDDRGVGKSGGKFQEATTIDFTTDAEAVLSFLKQHPDIDSTRAGLIGHSEGALVASVIAAQKSQLPFVVLMAGPGMKGEDIILRQTELISKNMGISQDVIDGNIALNQSLYEVVKKNADTAKAASKMSALLNRFNKKHDSDTTYQKISLQEIKGMIETLNSPWFRCFLTLDPQDYLTKIHCPLLAVTGSLDLQVPAGDNLKAIESAQLIAGNPDCTIVELPGLNHLFQPAKTGGPEEYASIEQTVAPEVLDTIGNWLTTLLKMKP